MNRLCRFCSTQLLIDIQLRDGVAVISMPGLVYNFVRLKSGMVKNTKSRKVKFSHDAWLNCTKAAIIYTRFFKERLDCDLGSGVNLEN